MQVDITEPNCDGRTHAKDLTVGQVGEVIDTSYTGKHLLMCCNLLVCLENPADVFPATNTLAVRVLPKNTKISLTTVA